MLKEKLSGKLVKSIIAPHDALKAAGVSGPLLSMDASWYRAMDGDKEIVKMASFAFLLSDGGKPIQVQAEFEKGEFKTTTKDLSSEMGDVNEEGEFLDSVKLMDDASAVEKIEKNTRVQTAMKKARHLRLASLSFILFDDIYEAPVWHAVLKNWPLTNYFKREKPVTLEVSIEAVRGNTLSFRQII